MKPNNSQLPIQSLRINYVVGIDPDQDKSGVAIYSRIEKRLIAVACLGFADLLNLLNEQPKGETIFYLEAGWLNSSVWHGEPPTAGSWPIRSRLANAAEVGRRVGINHGVGICLHNYLLCHNDHDLVRLEKPTTTKWDAETFAKMTGWKGRTNPETRDAGRIAFKYQ